MNEASKRYRQYKMNIESNSARGMIDEAWTKSGKEKEEYIAQFPEAEGDKAVAKAILQVRDALKSLQASSIGDKEQSSVVGKIAAGLKMTIQKPEAETEASGKESGSEPAHGAPVAAAADLRAAVAADPEVLGSDVKPEEVAKLPNDKLMKFFVKSVAKASGDVDEKLATTIIQSLISMKHLASEGNRRLTKHGVARVIVEMRRRSASSLLTKRWQLLAGISSSSRLDEEISSKQENEIATAIKHGEIKNAAELLAAVKKYEPTYDPEKESSRGTKSRIDRLSAGLPKRDMGRLSKIIAAVADAAGGGEDIVNAAEKIINYLDGTKAFEIK